MGGLDPIGSLVDSLGLTGHWGSLGDLYKEATELWSICQFRSSMRGIEKINGERGCKNRHSQIKTDKDLGYSGDTTEITPLPPTL